VKSNSLNIGIK